MEYIEHGKSEGAKVEIGGERHGDCGYYIQPTIFSNVDMKMKIVQEEIFGPVASIAKFKTVDDIIEAANGTSYGLAAAIHTKNIETALKMADELHAGTVWV